MRPADEVEATLTITCHKCGCDFTHFVPTMFWIGAPCTACAAKTYICRKGSKVKQQIAKPKNGIVIR